MTLNKTEAPVENDCKEHCTDCMKKAHSVGSSNHGIALLITLWLIVILNIMAISFSSLVKTDIYSTFAFKESIENKYYAEAGLQRGIAEIFYRIAAKKNKALDSGKSLETAFQVDGTPYTEKIGDGFYKIRIMDEGGKININALSDQTAIILSNLLVQLGLEREKADRIVNAIMDWRDEDEETRIKGAESNYYMSLLNPYKAKNREFDSLDELNLIKDLTPEIIYGEGTRRGMIHFVTVYSNAPQINLDVASKEVLLSIPGITPDIEEGILKARLKNDIDTIRNYQNKIGNLNQNFMPYLGIGETNVYTIYATGYKDQEQRGYAITATLVIDGNNKFHFLNYKSPGYIMQ